MAEYYLSSSASGSGDGSIGDPWTLAQFYAGCAAGDIGWVKKDGTYTIAADISTAAAGSVAAGSVRLIGYNSTIGDGYLGRDSIGKLITTNFPLLALGAFRLRPAVAFHTLENLHITGTSTVNVVSLGSDSLYLSCKISNTSSGAAVRQTTNYVLYLNNDFDSATGSGIETGGNGWRVIANRFNTPSGTGVICNGLAANVTGNVFDDCSVGFSSSNSISGHTIASNTFFNCGTGISLTSNNNSCLVLNNIFRDCTTRIAHTNISYLINNRSVEITTMNSGTNTGFEQNNITTAGDDFVDSANENFYLQSSSPAREAGLWQYWDIGAMQSEDSGGGGGGFYVSQSARMLR